MASKLMKRRKGKGKAQDHLPSATHRPPATVQVLHTYELLEHILLCLDPPDLRRARCVSKTWNEVITRSQPLDSAWQLVDKRYMEEIRMMLFGDRGVGKHTLLLQFMNLPPGYYDPTCGRNRKQVFINRRHWIYEVDLWSRLNDDSAYLQQYFGHTHCYGLVYAANSITSFRAIREWKRKLDCIPAQFSLGPASGSRFPRNVRVIGALVETKCDLKNHREVPTSDGLQLARELGCAFLQTSSHARHNVDKVFGVMAEAYIDAIEQNKVGLVRSRPFGDFGTAERLETASHEIDEWSQSVAESLIRI